MLAGLDDLMGLGGAGHRQPAVHDRPDRPALDVTVAGLAYGQECELVVVDREGDRHPAGEWTATYSGEATWEGWSAVAPSSLAEIVLLDDAGRELVRVRT